MSFPQESVKLRQTSLDLSFDMNNLSTKNAFF
jgi:hypothetical protein